MSVDLLQRPQHEQIPVSPVDEAASFAQWESEFATHEVTQEDVELAYLQLGALLMTTAVTLKVSDETRANMFAGAAQAYAISADVNGYCAFLEHQQLMDRLAREEASKNDDDDDDKTAGVSTFKAAGKKKSFWELAV
jgi:hypothetical protein